MNRKNNLRIDRRALRVFTTKLANFGPSSTASTIEFVSLESIPRILDRSTRQTFQAENFTGACRIVAVPE